MNEPKQLYIQVKYTMQSGDEGTMTQQIDSIFGE